MQAEVLGVSVSPRERTFTAPHAHTLSMHCRSGVTLVRAMCSVFTSRLSVWLGWPVDPPLVTFAGTLWTPMPVRLYSIITSQVKCLIHSHHHSTRYTRAPGRQVAIVMSTPSQICRGALQSLNLALTMFGGVRCFRSSSSSSSPEDLLFFLAASPPAPVPVRPNPELMLFPNPS